MSAPRKPELTSGQRFSVEQARELIARAPDDIYANEQPSASTSFGMDYAYAWGRITPFVKDMLAIIDELTGGARP